MRVDTERSSLTFVAPFLFDPTEAASATAWARAARFDARVGCRPVWERETLDTTDWLPHLAETLVGVDDRPPIAESYQATDEFLAADGGLTAPAGYEYVPRGKAGSPIPLRLTGLRLMLFRNGVGFVIQRWVVASESPAAWLDVQHYGHYAQLERGGHLRLARGQNTADGARPFPDPFGRKRADSSGSPNDLLTGNFADLTAVALDSADLGPDRRTKTRDVFLPGRSLPYAVVFLTDDGDPDWLKEKVLYKLRRLFHAGQAHHPTAEQLALAPPNFHPYLRDQWFYFSLEGGGFAAVDVPDDDFFRHALPRQLEREYFLPFLLALHQRFSLMDLSADVARHWRSDRRAQSRHDLEAVFERIRDRLFDFTGRYQFSQVVQRESHHRCYQLWRETFQTAELYREVSEEVREMSEYLQYRNASAREERVGLLTVLLTVLIGAPSLAIGFWGINIIGHTSNEGMTLWEAFGRVGLLAASLAGIFAAVWFLTRRK